VLDDCDEKSPSCLLVIPQKEASLRYYLKVKDDPEYKRKRKEQKKRYLQTATGKANWAAQAARYRKKYPEVMRAAGRRYHERHREERLAAHREYMRKRRNHDSPNLV